MELDMLTKKTILERDTFLELFSESDDVEFTRMHMELSDRAKELGVKQKFEELFQAYKKQDKKSSNPVSERDTDFTLPEGYHNMACGSWVANNNGIRTYNIMGMELIACYHPILPVQRLKNVETGEELIKLIYRRNHVWKDVLIEKETIASASKIVTLAKYGIAVTSETAKYLVKFLADIENRNEDEIDLTTSTSKLGWHEDSFIPYDGTIVFDSFSRFRALFESVHERGDYDQWLDHVREIRNDDRTESKFLLAASFAAPLVKLLGNLPFFVDLWGETEGGKTVSLMLAASVWGNPAESQYIGDFKTTDTALEAKADMLNNLPVILDDTSKSSRRIHDNFESVVYDLCSGKGKSRSNKTLGTMRENHWATCFLVNGEKPLSEYVQQGGAVNRILEVSCDENVYMDPRKTADILKHNYGFAGRKYIEILKQMGVDEIKQIYEGFFSELLTSDKMQKQVDSLAVVLTADRIATDYIFKDGSYIDIEKAKQSLTDRNLVSDNQRAYEIICDLPVRFSSKFINDVSVPIDRWGIVDSEYVIIICTAFNKICSDNEISKNSFLKWAKKKGLLLLGKDGQPSKTKRIGESSPRCYWIKKPVEDGFIEVDDSEIPEELQEM